jgi:hypothetical protein
MDATNFIPDGILQDYYGSKISLDNLDRLEICMHSIALSMANSARFNGMTQSFYSVAQHSTIMSYLVEDMYEGHNLELAKAALLHDCSEYLIGDIVNPVKKRLGGVYDIEEKVARRIFEAHNVDFNLWGSEELKELDWILYNTETRDLRPYCILEDPSVCIDPSEVIINPQMPPAAFENYKMRYNRLFKDSEFTIGNYGV